MPQRMERLHPVGEEGKHRGGLDRIEQISNVVVARCAGHSEQAAGVTAALRHLQISLEIQERRALGEKDRERTNNGGVRHGILDIITGAFIWKPLNG